MQYPKSKQPKRFDSIISDVYSCKNTYELVNEDRMTWGLVHDTGDGIEEVNDMFCYYYVLTQSSNVFKELYIEWS